MASVGTAFFDAKGQFFKCPEDATISDLASILGRIGEADGLTQGIAKILLERRDDVERIFADHDGMLGVRHEEKAGEWPVLLQVAGNVATIR
ncbi:MAG: hypothetical protein RIS52_1121 [Pseudomonadota bacterium]|jgi:hypothetical protein